MEHKKLNRFIALGVFFSALIVYIKTLPPTVVFWDVGEFCAAAYSLQVPHPPGAPLFLLLGRIASMIPFVHDIAVRMHFISALGSALTCGMLYLMAVEMILIWKGIPDTLFDQMAIYGSSAIGAFSLAFSGTFWFNALEAEVYGLSTTFVALIILLALKWYNCADKDSGDRYILLIAYIVGLSMGVHLLAVLALFPVMLLWYFHTHPNFEWKSFLLFTIGSVAIFLIIYPGIVKILPSLLDGEFEQTKSVIFTYIPAFIFVAALCGVYFSIRMNKRILNISLLSFLLIIAGYSTYTMVFIRANAHTPMNENDPSTLSRLVSYLNRDQYGGDAPIFNRRWDIDPDKRRFHQNYSSDLEYMWQYQMKHMYLRYLGWNYIGAESDSRNAGVDWRKLFMVPFIFGLIGVFYQWRRQPGIALSMITAFLMMGIILALYQNQQEPQPRERDYFYAGSFFIFSLWIAYGTLGIIDFVKEKMSVQQNGKLAACGILLLAFIFIPLNMLRTNYKQADRSGNFTAWDYSYNMLQSCEPDAILVTNGDNDTFPLWYLQDVEGIRRDIRIVNLSLANTPWYIKQLKNETPYGSKKVPISLQDVEIENIRPVQFDPGWVQIGVDPDIIEKYRKEADAYCPPMDTSVTQSGVIRFYMPNTIQSGITRGLRAQDIVLYNIIFTSKFQRPVYFALTMPDNAKIGLQNFMQLTGLTFKLVPWRSQIYWSNINETMIRQNLFTDVNEPSKDFKPGFMWRGFKDSTVYYDEDTRNLISTNYRNAFIAYLMYCANVKKRLHEAAPILDRMEEVLSRHSVPMDYRIKFDIASFYQAVGRNDRYREYLNEVITKAKEIISKPVTEPLSVYNPYIMLYRCYDGLEMFKEAEELLPLIRSTYKNQMGIDKQIDELAARLRAKQSQAQTRK